MRAIRSAEGRVTNGDRDGGWIITRRVRARDRG